MRRRWKEAAFGGRDSALFPLLSAVDPHHSAPVNPQLTSMPREAEYPLACSLYPPSSLPSTHTQRGIPRRTSLAHAVHCKHPPVLRQSSPGLHMPPLRTCSPASISRSAALRQLRYSPWGSSNEKVNVEPCRNALQWAGRIEMEGAVVTSA